MNSRRHLPGGLALVDLLALLAVSGCGGEFVIGVFDEAQTSAASSSSTNSDTSYGLDGQTTVADGSGTSSGSQSSSSDATAGDSSSSSGAVVECEAPEGHTVCDTDTDVFHAIGLGCPGAASDTYPIVDPVFTSPEANAWRIIREYGNPLWAPTEGTNLLALTTGLFPAADGSGRVEIPMGQTDAPVGNNGNPNGVDLPSPILPDSGSQGGAGGLPFMECDGLGDCSESLPDLWMNGGPADDLVWMSFDIDVPAGTLGYRVDLAWFSAEFASRADQDATDVAVWWQSSEAFTGNVATIDGNALAASEIAAWVATNGVHGAAPELVGTGYEGTTGSGCSYPGGAFPDCPRGGGTRWMTLDGPAMPRERMTMTVALFDLGDQQRDTAILLDGWRWHCEGCEPGVDCGLSP